MEIKKDQQINTEVLGSFFLNTSEFALPVKSIHEVVNSPEKFSSLPLSPPFLLGVFNLRGTVIPVVDLKVILELGPDQQPLASKKIGIVEFEGVKIGLLFDRTGEIFRCSANDKSEFTYAGNKPKQNLISGALKLENGKRIIQILDAMALLKLERIPRSSQDATQSETLLRRRQGSRKQCISFLIGENRCAFGIDVIHEIIKVPALNESMMSSGNCIGTFDLRGDIVSVIDFGLLLKYPKKETNEKFHEDQRVIIMKMGSEKFGLLIDSVESIVTYYTEELLDFPIISTEKAALFLGCLSREGIGDIIVLNHEQILTNGEIEEITKGHSKIYQTSSSRGLDEMKKKGHRKSYITFQIDNLLALGIDEVREVIEFPSELLQPPGLPTFVRGMLNLRGKIITILDPRALYGENKTSPEKNAKVLIFDRSGVCYGMIVDSVENIVSFSDEEKIKLPEILYKNESTQGIRNDIKFAVEIEIGEEKKTLMVLNLDPLADRVGLSSAQRATA